MDILSSEGNVDLQLNLFHNYGLFRYRNGHFDLDNLYLTGKVAGKEYTDMVVKSEICLDRYASLDLSGRTSITGPKDLSSGGFGPMVIMSLYLEAMPSCISVTLI